MKNLPTVSLWTSSELPTEAALRGLLQAEQLDYYTWSNAAGDVYAAHAHSYDKVIYVARGSITFHLPQSDQTLILRAGDRLDLPAGIIHEAQVGSEGVVCFEAHR